MPYACIETFFPDLFLKNNKLTRVSWSRPCPVFKKCGCWITKVSRADAFSAFQSFSDPHCRSVGLCRVFRGVFSAGVKQMACYGKNLQSPAQTAIAQSASGLRKDFSSFFINRICRPRPAFFQMPMFSIERSQLKKLSLSALDKEELFKSSTISSASFSRTPTSSTKDSKDSCLMSLARSCLRARIKSAVRSWLSLYSRIKRLTIQEHVLALKRTCSANWSLGSLKTGKIACLLKMSGWSRVKYLQLGPEMALSNTGTVPVACSWRS